MLLKANNAASGVVHSGIFEDPDGKVGIGTTSPYSLLSISNSVVTAPNTPLLTIASTTAGTATSTLMTVLANGRVGINKANPSYALDVTGSINAPISLSGGNVWVGGYQAINQLGTTLELGNYETLTGISLFSGNTKVLTTYNGNVGIANTSPVAKLTIGGISTGINGSFLVRASTDSEWFSVGVAGNGIIQFNGAGGITNAGGVDLGARFNIKAINDSKRL